ncbi:unnamed protein product [Sphagnum jensenii]|uniref:Uncharacterized protein n=1 Tax=Sphagnum jensenii TaxID=128206 RepID=A0ABP1AGP3_9BRYO
MPSDGGHQKLWSVMEDIRNSGLGWRTSEALDCYGHHQKLWIVMDTRSLLVVSSSFYVEQTSLLVNNLVFSPEVLPSSEPHSFPYWQQQQQQCLWWKLHV